MNLPPGEVDGEIAAALRRVLESFSIADPLVNRLQSVVQALANALARRATDPTSREGDEVNWVTPDQSAVGIAHVSADGRWQHVNDKLCAIVGYTRDELLALTVRDITHPDDLEADITHVRRVLSGAITMYSREKRYVKRDRSSVWVNVTVSLARTAAGEPRHFISIVEDITDRKHAQEALRTSEARLAEGTTLAGLAFYDVDFDRGVIYIDKAFRDICGIPPESNAGLGALEFWMAHLHPADREAVLQTRQQMQVGGLDRASQEYRYLHPTTGERWIHHTAGVAGRDATGRPRGRSASFATSRSGAGPRRRCGSRTWKSNG